jgi:hypothetical protein
MYGLLKGLIKPWQIPSKLSFVHGVFKKIISGQIVKIHEGFFIFVMFCTRKNYWPCQDIPIVWPMFASFQFPISKDFITNFQSSNPFDN